jgi:hypothetical protein
MPERDWSQFIPDLIIAIISVLFAAILAGAIAYFKSEKGKNWFNRLPKAMGQGGKWLVEKWYFVLPLCMVIIISAIAFRLYGDWKLVSFSFASYIIGLLSWALFKSRQRLFGKKHARDTITPKFLPIPISAGFGNSYLKNRYINPPIGDVALGGVQFRLEKDSLIFDTNEHIRYCLPLDDGGKQVEFQLSKSVNRVNSVYLLINSGNSKNIYANRSIGRIRLVFKEAPPIDVELELGKNIREWCPGNSGDYIRETSSPGTIIDVWKGMSKNGANAVIDCLKIPVYEIMKDCYLEKIIFTHRSFPQPPDTMGVHYSVFGISLEIHKVV